MITNLLIIVKGKDNLLPANTNHLFHMNIILEHSGLSTQNDNYLCVAVYSDVIEQINDHKHSHNIACRK